MQAEFSSGCALRQWQKLEIRLVDAHHQYDEQQEKKEEIQQAISLFSGVLNFRHDFSQFNDMKTLPSLTAAQIWYFFFNPQNTRSNSVMCRHFL
jgi:hypothetical protein